MADPLPSSLAADDAPRDDEGLLLEYDVVLCGTGLVQSILASALARAGKTVLHCDASDYYGELDAVWTLPYLLKQQQEQPSSSTVVKTAVEPIESTGTGGVKDDVDTSTAAAAATTTTCVSIPLSPKGAFDSLKIHSMETRALFPITVGTEVLTPYGIGLYQGPVDSSTSDADTEQQPHLFTSLAITLSNWKLANDSHPTVYIGIPTTIAQDDETAVTSHLQEKHKIQSTTAHRAHLILQKHSRSLALDITPGLLFAAGASVTGLIKSNVAEYLEFKSLEGLLWLNDDNNNDSNTSRQLERVPCSKNDVFGTRLLSPMDKRRLMKFLQLAMDYATAEQAAEYEREQAAIITTANTAAAPPIATTTTDQEEEVRSLNERHLNQGRSLARPQNKAVSTGDIQALEQCIEQGMDFETYLTEKQKLSPKLQLLVRYALTLESKRPDSASKRSLQDGMKNLCHHIKSLGRFGSSAFLVPLYGSGELPQAFCRSAAVYGATYLLRRAPLSIITSKTTSNNNDGDVDTTTNFVKGIILGGDDQDGLSGKPIPKSKQVSCTHVVAPQQAMQMLPSSRRVLRQISILSGKPVKCDPNTTDQRHAVILPPNSVGNADTIHGLLLDEKVNVAPHVPGGCTVLHLTTTVDQSVDITKGILEQAMNSIVSPGGVNGVHEIFRVVFSYSLHDNEEEEGKDKASTSVAATTTGLHTIHRPRPGLAADPAFEQAAAIFRRICPGAEFLAMSKAMDEAVKERVGDARNEDDDERMVLESAMDMIETPKEE